MEAWSAKEYAAWVFEYRSSGFWQKVQPFFETWKKHLGMMKWSKDFWDEYKRLRDGVTVPDSATLQRENDAYLDYEESFQ
jgi:hypothetical protein